MTDDTGTIHADMPTDHGFETTEDAVDAFMTNLTGEATPPNESAEATETSGNTETAEGSAETTESDADPNDPDEQEVEIKVGDETKKAKLKELKRLFGQEAALTQKSQKVAEAAKVAETRDAHASHALRSMLERAESRYKPYAELDMLVLSQRMDTESFEALRKDAAAAEADVKFIKTELGTHVEATRERTQTAYREAAQACVKALSDPAQGIKGWGPQLYNDISAWAAEQGTPDVRNLVDPSAWKIVHMAYQFARQQDAAKTAEAKVQKAVNTPTKVLRPKGAASSPANRQSDALKTLRRTGSIDAAVDAFSSGLGDN